MNCTIDGCPGIYEEKEIVHTVRHRGKVVVFDGVPAEVCSICGDVLFKPDIVRHIEQMLVTVKEPTRMVPLFEYA